MGILFYEDRNGFSPGMLSGLQAWYDTSTSNSDGTPKYLTVTGGTSITQFLDRSGNGNDTAVQGTGTARPTWTAAQLNGLPLAVFDGGDYLAMPAALFSVAGGANTVFAVAKRDTESGVSANIFLGANGTTAVHYMQFTSTAGTCGFKNRNVAGGGVTNAGNTNTNYQILTGQRNGTTQSITVNGGTASTNTNGVNGACLNMYMGGGDIGAGLSELLTGAISEILIYNRALTDAEIVQVNRYLSFKFAITIA